MELVGAHKQAFLGQRDSTTERGVVGDENVRSTDQENGALEENEKHHLSLRMLGETFTLWWRFVLEYTIFSFAAFARWNLLARLHIYLNGRKSLTSVFEIIDRVPKIDPGDNSGRKPPNVFGSIELKNVDFCYPTSSGDDDIEQL
ncbi:hypothetical protein IFM89_009467 [Coptis chinensis]|uniref:Uncharacterized protein n=1 Tax=Coptis chinensis TaxID=261450 RepID=A0A835IA30_9MAGN|nr:hypothetical protein IFM89_009467 [Coptis chinensis]